MNKKVKSLLVCGLVALNMVGCSNKQLDMAEECIEKSLKEKYDYNIETYNTTHWMTNEERELNMSIALDNKDINVEVEELEDVYEVNIYFISEESETKFIANVDKDVDIEKLNYDILKNSDYTSWKEMDMITKDKISRRIVKGYDGIYKDDYDNDIYVRDEMTIIEMFLINLGLAIID